MQGSAAQPPRDAPGAGRQAVHPGRPRREHEVPRSRLEFKDLLIDLNERRVVRQGDEISLTHTEFELLSLLAANAGKALSRERILQHIWGQGHQGDIETRVIDVHVRNLRRKIELEPSRPFYVLAVPGIGYRFTNARSE